MKAQKWRKVTTLLFP